ncbi:MAG: transposase, partial [Chloroflexi bacterium]|nr:transposase [Chloroflexota bacterium]
MIHFKQMMDFAQQLFIRKKEAQQVANILYAFWKACSARLTEVSHHMQGDSQPETKYKALQRFLRRVDVKAVLWRLFQPDAPFVLCDVTEIERPQARRTEYVGRLKDGKTRGFWLLLLATPFHGRAIPFHFIIYSSQTIQQEASSRNMNHFRALQGLRELIGEKPLVMDREFSYLEFLLHLV